MTTAELKALAKQVNAVIRGAKGAAFVPVSVSTLRVLIDELLHYHGLLTAEPEVLEYHYAKKKGFSAYLKHWYVKVLARAASEWLFHGRDRAKANYATAKLCAPGFPAVELTVRKCGGKTPSDRIGELEAELKRATARIERLKRRLK